MLVPTMSGKYFLSLFEEIIRLAKFNTQKTLKSGVCSSKSVCGRFYFFQLFFIVFLSLLLPVSGSACRKESEGKEGKQRFEEKSDGEIRSFSFSQQSGPIFKRSFSEVFFSRVRSC